MLMVLGPNPKRVKPVAVADKKPDTPDPLSASDGQTEKA
jgi:hypothetical protein